MKFNQESLLKAVGTVAGVVSAKPSKDALRFVRITAGKSTDAQEVLIHGTDLEVHVQACVVAEEPITKPIEISLPGHGLLSVLRVLPPGCSVRLEVGDTTCQVIAGGTEYELPLGEPGALPDMPAAEESFAIALDSQVLSQAFQRVSYAAAREASRYSMTGVRVEISGQELRLIATDGRRLALTSVDLDGCVTGELAKVKGVTLPARAVSMVERVSTGVSVLSWTPRQFSFTSLDADNRVIERVVSLLIDGAFPAYEAVLPKDKPRGVADFDPQELAQAIKSCSVMVDAETRRMSLHVGDLGTVLEATGQGLGRARIQTGMKLSSGKAEAVFLNPGYLVDVVKHAGPKARMEIRDPAHPVLVIGERYKSLLMPLT